MATSRILKLGYVGGKDLVEFVEYFFFFLNRFVNVDLFTRTIIQTFTLKMGTKPMYSRYIYIVGVVVP